MAVDENKTLTEVTPETSVASPKSIEISELAEETETNDLFDKPLDVDLLPALPEVALQLRALLNDNMPPIKRIIKTILLDPSLTLRVLALLTKSSVTIPTNTHLTVTRVVNFIGLSPLRSMLSSHVIFQDDFDLRAKSHFDLYAYWKHSVFTAIAAETIAKISKYPSSEEAYIAGLIHDIGKLALAYFQPEYSHKIQKSVRAQQESLKAEKRIMKTTHPQIGAKLGKQIHLPGDLLFAILRHHIDQLPKQNKFAEKQLSLIVYVANTVSKIFSEREHSNHYYYEGLANAQHYLNLSKSDYQRSVRETANQIYEIIDQFHLQVETLRNYCLELEGIGSKTEAFKIALQKTEASLRFREIEVRILDELIPLFARQAERNERIIALAKSISAVANMEHIAVFLYDPRTGQLVNKIQFGMPNEDPLRWAKFDPTTKVGVFVATFTRGENFCIDTYDGALPPEVYDPNELAMLRRFPFATIALTSREGPVGVLYISHGAPDKTIDDQLVAILAHIGHLVCETF